MAQMNVPRWFQQFAVLAMATSTIGIGATYLVFAQSKSSSTVASRSLMESAAIKAAFLTNQHQANGIHRVTKFVQSEGGLFVEENRNRFIALSSEANESLADQRPIISDTQHFRNGVSVKIAYIPLSAHSLAIVEVNESELLIQQSEVENMFKIAVIIVILAACVISLLLCRAKWISIPRLNLGLGNLLQKRSWITIGLIVVSIALTFDGVQSFSRISRAEKSSTQSEETLSLCKETYVNLDKMGVNFDRDQLKQAIVHFGANGQLGVEAISKEVIASANLNSTQTLLLKEKLIQLANESLSELQASNLVVRNENSAQSIRLVLVTVFGLFALLLMNAVSAREHEIMHTVDEAKLARIEYESLVGNLPIGLFVFSTGRVIYSNGAWNRSPHTNQDDEIQHLVEEDRVLLMTALEKAEIDMQPFSCNVKVLSENTIQHFETFGAPIMSESGRIRRILVFCINVTPIISAKEEISRKHKEVEEKNYQLHAAITQVEGALETFVETIVRAVEIRDTYTAGHSNRVSQYSVWIGIEMGLSDFDLRTLAHGALCHDVGKIGIPDKILLKPSSLTREEFAVIQDHPMIGVRILGDILSFRNSLPIVRWHHERLDGSGYPDGLQGDEIPLLVRIVAVADVFDALTSSRSYRNSSSTIEAMEIIANNVSLGKLDAIAYDCLHKAITKHGTIPQEEAA